MVRVESLLAQGNTSDVYALGADAVVKVPRPGVPDHWIEIEAEYAAAVYQAGLPTPMILDVVRVEGRPSIVFERIDGPSMLDVLRDDHRAAESLAESMCAIQHSFHATDAPAALPTLADRVASKIDQTEMVSAGERDDARAVLAALAGGGATCHGDVHPGNILMSDRGPMVIDWFDATRGPAVADVVRSSLVVRPLTSGDESPHLAGVPNSVLATFHTAYLASALATMSLDLDDALAWEAVLAVSRSTEPVEWSLDDLRASWSRFRAGANAADSPLAGLLTT